MASEMEKTFLPFELIINILTRLPIKSIVKFQCVCKQWKELINTQSFISQHAHHHSAQQNPFLLIHAYDDINHQRSTLQLLNHNMQTDQLLNTSFIDSFRRGWTIVGSSNGLICVELAAQRVRLPKSYLLWNPLTNQVREVPQSVYEYAPEVGFGYSSVVDDYKIVRFYHPYMQGRELEPYCGYERLYGVQVFSLRSGSWKDIEMGDLHDVQISDKGAHVNGTIFWYSAGYPFEMLIAFDLATEVFTITPIDLFSANVDVDEYGHCPYRLYEYGNKLAMCVAVNVYTGESTSYNMYLWVIEEVVGESGKSYTCIEKYKFAPILYGVQPMCFWRNQIVCPYVRIKSEEVEGDEDKYLHLLNLISKEWNKFPNFSGAYDPCAIFNYDKSLRASLQHLH